MQYTPPKRTAHLTFEGGIREILAKAEEMERAGRSVIHMEIGRPDFDSPKCAKDAAAKALQNGDVHYTDMAGTMELRGEVAKKFKRDCGVDVDPATEIIITTGANEALMVACMALLDDGDEVIIPAPYFPSYSDQVTLMGGTVKSVPCRIENGFRPRVEDIAAAVTPKTKAILINTPNNPTGAAFTRQDLEGIAKLCAEKNIWVISDECYEKFLYEGEHVSMVSLPGMKERTITLSAASKTYSMTGWRVGWAVAPAPLRKYMLKCHQSTVTCATSFAQAGVAEALRSADDDVTFMIAEYKKRRDLMVGALSQIKGFDVPTPGGAFYVFPSIKGFGMGSDEFCRRLLEEGGVSAVPGQAFGVEDGYIRLAYCRPESEIREATNRITAFAKKITG